MNAITTFTGRKINPLDPHPDDINIIDIAHALGNICRYTGHVRSFYSVGEHSCRVHDLVSVKNRLYGILHDASEAYICDLAAPVKTSKEMKFFKEIEKNLMDCIYTKYGLDIDEPEEVHVVDKRLGCTEQRDLMPPGSANGNTFEPFDNIVIRPWTPVVATSEMQYRIQKLGIEYSKR